MTSSTGHELFGIPESVKFYPLCLSMFAVIVFAPITVILPVIGTILISVVMLSGILVVGRRRSILVATLVLAIPAVISRWLESLGIEPIFDRVTFVSSLAVIYYVFVASIVLMAVLRHKNINHNTVIGAICVYLLIAFAYAQGFAIVEHLQPGSIRGLDDMVLDGGFAEISSSSSIMTYFSFVTITTLGYGDISPVSPIARSMVISETLVGQLFLIGFVARLVGMVSTTQKSQFGRECDDSTGGQ